MKTPQPLSVGEETFALHCQAHGLKPDREYYFHPKRLFRFDFFFHIKGHQVAVEVEGGNNGRHQRRKGFRDDCFKYNLAAKMGILVLRYTTEMVTAGHAIDDMLEMLG